MEIFMRNLEMAEAGFVGGALVGSNEIGVWGTDTVSSDATRDYLNANWQADWVVRYDAGGSWVDTGNSCVQLTTHSIGSDPASVAQTVVSWLDSAISRCTFTEIQVGTGGINFTFDCGPK
jgi:hypothetical protein